MKMTPRQIIDELAKMDYREMKEFRVRLVERLGMDFGPSDDGGTGVPSSPKAPVLSGSAKALLEEFERW